MIVNARSLFCAAFPSQLNFLQADIWTGNNQLNYILHGVVQTLKAVLPPQTSAAGFEAENNAWAKLAFTPKAAEIMGLALQNGAQTPGGELELEKLLRKLT